MAINQIGAVQAQMDEKKEDKEKKGPLDRMYELGMTAAQLQQLSTMLPEKQPAPTGGIQTDPSRNQSIMRRISRTA